ncbi:Esterase/lipase/thioesterase [Ceratobasidium sp. 423]|nr:Esterase/lipase/thioesterase [Ceratobasidium sp. 423]
MLALPVLLLTAATTVLGHGYVQEIVASSGKYTGYLPYNDPYTTPAPQRIVRKIPGIGPIKDVTSIDLQCNARAVPAPAIAQVAAGSNVALNWTTWPESHIGPVITYMARTPSDIKNWSPGTSVVWFKVNEQGLVDGKWAATDILTENKSIYTFKVPASLKAGQYLIRHEIIALHSVLSGVHSVEVTGSGTETGPSSLVAFPGAYKSTDPGILFDAYKGATTYVIPGPPVWTGGSSSGNAPAPATTAQTTSTTTRSTTTQASSPTTTPSGSTVPQFGQCGGLTYTGPTTYAPPYTCKYNNDYYSQCL